MRFKTQEKLVTQTIQKGAKLELNLRQQTRIQTMSSLSNGVNINLKNGLESKEKHSTKTVLKRRVLVYKKEGKFYIDYAAAHALKLTNVRAVITENEHLVEVDETFLQKCENDEEIDVEYLEMDKSKRPITQERNELESVLEKLLEDEYGIGIHGIDKGDWIKKQETAESIVENGLNIKYNSKTILSTAISLGTNGDSRKIEQEILDYQFGKGSKVSVIIAVPSFVRSKTGEKIFLGFPEENKKTSGQQYEEHCILDRICAKLGTVPPEFILGYYSENIDGTHSFMENTSHYSKIPDGEKETLFEKLESSMDDFSKTVNECIKKGNIKKLSEMLEMAQERGLGCKLLENAIELAGRLGEKNKVRQVLINVSENKSTEKNENIKPKTRRILVGAYSELKTSDLECAQSILKEGLEEPNRENKGRIE